MWRGRVCLGGSRPDASDNLPTTPLFLVFQVVLSPRTQWDHLPRMPHDVPCVVELGPPQRVMAQTQPPLVGTDAQALPPALPVGAWGPCGVCRAAVPLLPFSPPPRWEHTGQRVCLPNPGTPSTASPVSSSHRAGPGRTLCFLLDLPVGHPVSLVPLPGRSRKVHEEERTFRFQPQAEEQAGGVRAPGTVVSGCCALGTSPSRVCLCLLASCDALPISHCVRTPIPPHPRPL